MMIIHELHVTMRKQKEIPFWRIVVNNWFKVYKNDNFMEDKTETCSRTQESIKIRELKAMYDPDQDLESRKLIAPKRIKY